MTLQGKKILVGITGSIAAYKVATLIRLLMKEGAEVQVIATPSALSFIPALTLATLSKKPVLSQLVSNEDTGIWNNHVALGLWADCMLIAPLSAKSLAAMAHGYADNLLLTTYLSARCPVIVAPAMDLDMYQHPTTQQNLQRLISFGHTVIEAREGELASGLEGKGRMAEPEELLTALKVHFETTDTPKSLDFSGKNVLVTAGPTHEFIDPVRYISNGSSGKMGFALAKQLAQQGAKVTLISGPVALEISHPNLTIVRVQTAKEMYEATSHAYPKVEVAIFAAAVSDYTPQTPAPQKIKKQTDTLSITLIKNPDIAFEMGKRKKPSQLNVGFALETHDAIAHAQQKMQKKNFDMVVLNTLQDEGAGFGHSTNKITILRGTEQFPYPLKPKEEVAKDILFHIHEMMRSSQ